MTSIGGQSFSSFAGEFTRGRIAARVVRREGIDGVGVIFGKWGAEPDRFVTTAYAANAGAAATLAEAYRTIVKACATGTLVTVVDGIGTSWANVAVIDAVPRIALCIGPTNPYCVTCTWLLVPNSDSP